MASRSEICEVEAYSGVRYGESPRAFTCGGVRHEVAVVERAWRGPKGPVFFVRTPEGRRFTLAYDETTTVWTVSGQWLR